MLEDSLISVLVVRKLAMGIILAFPVALLAWAFFDSSFSAFFDLVLVTLGIREHRGVDTANAYSFNSIGSRLILLALLAISLLSALAFLFVLAFSNGVVAVSLKSLLFLVTCVCIWCGALGCLGRVQQAGFIFRFKRDASQIVRVSELLTADWPKNKTKIEFLGDVDVNTKNRNFLVLKSSHQLFSWGEKLGPLIRRLETGEILFDVNYRADWRIVFSPSGVVSKMFRDDFDALTIENVLVQEFALSDCLYLTQYSSTVNYK